ncbi:MAG TPA: sulfotransferase domain-containing protein, partial [Rhodanobacteraceae bacterium]|nr:sulfotransferase domain-containing protein [Rhodanobacteraceae bacterium]
KDRDEYLALYRGSEDAIWRGDASTNYLISEVAPESIKQISPDARIIVMLRPPVEMMHSYHSELVRHHHEDILDFHQAVAASADRRNGLRIPPATGVPKCLDYFAISRFAPQVECYLRVFGPDAVKIVLLEDMAAAPAETLREVLRFLGVEGSPQEEMRIHNETPRHGLLERIVKRIYGRDSVKRLTQMLLPYEDRRRLLALLRRTERGIARADPRDEALRQSCRSDVERLSALIGRNLGHWQPPLR